MKKTTPNRPDRMREYQVIKTDFIESCRTKRRVIYNERWSIGMAFLSALAIILTFATVEKRNDIMKSSSSVSSEPTPMPTTAPTATPEITPTTATIDLNQNIMELPTGSTGAFKAYEDINNIRREDSMQFRLKQFYRTDNLGFIRFNNYYVVAIGQFYSNRIGECFKVTFEERTIWVMVGDVKRIEDTVNGQYCKQNGSIIEFIINPEVMSENVQLQGDVSSLGMGGKVLSIEREEME